jgi:aspartate/methionine/tyrosine aminotransferase
MALKVSDRGRVPPFMVMDVLRAASEREIRGGAVLHLEIGQPSRGLPPEAAQEVARELVSGDPMGYTMAQGIPALRRRIAARARAADGVDIAPARGVCTMGAAAFLIAFLSAFAPGDRVALASPGLPGLSPHPEGGGGGAGAAAGGGGNPLSADGPRCWKGLRSTA